jgi:uncharacterized membrane protein
VPNTVFGLPAHPLLVHVPVVLIPLAALGALAIALRPSWRERFGLLVLGVAGVATIGAFLAASAGESLEEDIHSRSSTLHEHVEWGDRAKIVALVFFVATLALVAHDWWLRREAGRRSVGAAARRPPRWLAATLAGATIVTAIAATGAITWAGHLGAKAAWSDVVPTSAHSLSGTSDRAGRGDDG